MLRPLHFVTLFKVFVVRKNFLALIPSRNAHHSAKCHSEERSDEESAFAFRFLV